MANEQDNQKGHLLGIISSLEENLPLLVYFFVVLKTHLGTLELHRLLVT
jgi:hypothetical protein